MPAVHDTALPVDLAVAAGDAVGEAALRVGFVLLTIAAATDAVFAALDGARWPTSIEGAALCAIGVAGLVRPDRAATVLRPRGRVLVMAALFALAGALDWGVQSHYAEVAPAIVWIAAIASSRRWVLACVVVSSAGYVGDLLLAGHSVQWLLGPTGRSLVVNQAIDLAANAAAVLLVIALLRRFVTGAPARLRNVREGAPAVTAALASAVRLQLVEPAAESPIATLTEREGDVLERLASGFAPQEIALRLGLKESTVRTHISNIKRKLGARTLAHAAAIHARAQRER